MSSDRESRIVRSWLKEDGHEDANRVLYAVLDQLDSTPQRRAGRLARRFRIMNSSGVRYGIALAAAIVVVIAAIGISLLPNSNLGNSGTPSQSLTASPTPEPSPVAELPPAGALAVGRHPLHLAGVSLSIEIPSEGWVSNGEFGIDKDHQDSAESAGFIFWTKSTPDYAFADPCAKRPPGGIGPDLGRSRTKLGEAVANVPGTELVSGPSEVTVGGRAATHVVITIPNDISCDPNDFFLWEDVKTRSARYATERNSTIYVWIIQAEFDSLVWIDGETYEESGPQAEQELRQIVESIEFD
jgi:hypothetical protein